MTTLFTSMALITLVAILAPVCAQSIPNKPIPETVFLIIAGAVLGPHILGFIHINHAIDFVSELGLALLFLMAGFEIDPSMFKSNRGKVAGAVSVVSMLIAFALVMVFVSHQETTMHKIALAIAMSSTALGTLIPILKERGLMESAVGKTVIAHGTFGELTPVIAIALLLSVRSTVESLLILCAFAAIAIAVALFPKIAKSAGEKIAWFLTKNADTTSQTTVRATMCLLVMLIALAAAFQLDVVLGAFAAGFILRYTLPEDNHELEIKLEGIAFGFLIPLFFVVSGAKIDLTSVVKAPLVLLGFMGALIICRTIPVYIATHLSQEDKNTMSMRERLTSALYATMALPIIVAVTHLAVGAQAMSEQTASVLVSAGALTVLIIPVLTSLTTRVADVHPVQAVQEIAHDPLHALHVLRQHWQLSRQAAHDAHTLQSEAFKIYHEQRRQHLAHLDAVPMEDISGASCALSPEQLKQVYAAQNQNGESNSQTHQSFTQLNALSVQALQEFTHARDELLEQLSRDKNKSIRLKAQHARAYNNWQELKELGDAHWASLKQRGDTRWNDIKATGDKRWDYIKMLGDMQWEHSHPHDNSVCPKDEHHINASKIVTQTKTPEE